MLKIQFKIIAQKVMRKIEILPSIPIIFLKERETLFFAIMQTAIDLLHSSFCYHTIINHFVRIDKLTYEMTSKGVKEEFYSKTTRLRGVLAFLPRNMASA